MENCTFPRYSEDDIIVHIRSCLLTGSEAKSFSKNDLFPNVKPEVLAMIFMRALQRVYGIRLEHFYMMPVTFETAYPQMFEGFLPMGNLFIGMEHFLPICRVHDFQIADILNPKAKRTARFLSGILNFLFFRDSRREVYLEIQSKYTSAMEKVQRHQLAIQEAEVKLEKLNTIPANQQAEFKELSQDIQELDQKLNQEYQHKTNGLKEVIRQKKMEIAEKTQKLNEVKLTICNLKEEQQQLKAKIIESPEELTSYNERLKETLQKLKGEKREVIEKCEACRDTVEIFPSIQLELQLYQKKMQTQGENMDKLAGRLAEIRTLEDQIESSKTGFANAKTEEIALKRLVTAKREKLATTEIKIRKRLEETEQRHQAITEYCNKLQEKRGAACEKVTATHAYKMQLKGAIQQLHDNVGKANSKAEEIYLSLRDGMKKYHENLVKMVDGHMSAREDKIAELKTLF